MNCEVDQSGKVERLSQDTFIAFSNKNQYCIMIPKKIKQVIHYNYKKKIKQIKYKLFCIGVFYCIQRFIKEFNLITICDEYHGKDDMIKSILLSYIRKIYENFDENIIKFNIVGKDSNAHKVAIESFRGEHKANEILSEEEIMRYLK